MNNSYEGWELAHFDEARNFRNYEFDLCKQYIVGKTAEVGPGTGNNIKYYIPRILSIHLFGRKYSKIKQGLDIPLKYST